MRGKKESRKGVVSEKESEMDTLTLRKEGRASKKIRQKRCSMVTEGQKRPEVEGSDDSKTLKVGERVVYACGRREVSIFLSGLGGSNKPEGGGGRGALPVA